MTFEKEQVVETGVYVFEKARALQMTAQYIGADFLIGLLPGTKRVERRRDLSELKELQVELDALLHRDAKLFSSGRLPLSLLMPAYSREDLKRWWKTYPSLILDGLKIYRRRNENRSHEFSTKAQLADFPEYYRRNFHFQTDGYLSEESAHLYDHQVDMLFGGTSNAMRRLMVEPLCKVLPPESSRNLHILELGCGTGSATELLATLYSSANIKALDLSPPYLRVARKRLHNFINVHTLRGDAADLPFKSDNFDIVSSVFMFHELPFEVRKQVLAEAFRSLKPGGALVVVDSIQRGDSKHFDPRLDDFPKSFHEPFYKNYIQHPLKGLFEDAGFEVESESVGLASKCICGIKPKSLNS